MAICFPIPEVGPVITTVLSFIDLIFFLPPDCSQVYHWRPFFCVSSRTERAAIPAYPDKQY
jgi:hypothetical protein